ncbi:MAG: molecular chaperone DnaJ [Mycolicibacterium sp.]|nr:molecular chaperone DnaJ [Mycolicibacterium sp.]
MTTYPPNMTLRPLERWPRDEPSGRPRSQFSAGWSDTIGILMTELRQLGPSPRSGGAWAESSYPPSVLQVAIREKDFRNDGMPRANAVPTHPGVILNIESTKGPLSFPCDKFDRWTDNLRAIALGLRALRSVDRYGITPGDEQYTGWKSLPAPPSPNRKMSADEAAALLREIAGAPDGQGLDIGTLTQLHRRARAVAHPDRHDGDHTLAYRVAEAATMLTKAGML